MGREAYHVDKRMEEENPFFVNSREYDLFAEGWTSGWATGQMKQIEERYAEESFRQIAYDCPWNALDRTCIAYKGACERKTCAIAHFIENKEK